jgi:hypothetical protein
MRNDRTRMQSERTRVQSERTRLKIDRTRPQNDCSSGNIFDRISRVFNLIVKIWETFPPNYR